MKNKTQRYYFNLHSKYSINKDEEGQEFENLQDVVAEVKQTLLEIYSSISKEKNDFPLSFHVLNESGELACKASLYFKVETFQLEDRHSCDIMTEEERAQIDNPNTLTSNTIR